MNLKGMQAIVELSKVTDYIVPIESFERVESVTIYSSISTAT
jgi:hypothetical protein